MSAKVEGRVKIHVNGITLEATKKRGRWKFVCPHIPDFEKEFNNTRSLAVALDRFMQHAIKAIIKTVTE